MGEEQKEMGLYERLLEERLREGPLPRVRGLDSKVLNGRLGNNSRTARRGTPRTWGWCTGSSHAASIA